MVRAEFKVPSVHERLWHNAQRVEHLSHFIMLLVRPDILHHIGRESGVSGHLVHLRGHFELEI